MFNFFLFLFFKAGKVFGFWNLALAISIWHPLPFMGKTLGNTDPCSVSLCSFDFVYLCHISPSVVTMLKKLRLLICLLYKSCSIVWNCYCFSLTLFLFCSIFFEMGEQDCQLYLGQIKNFCNELMIISVLFSVSFLIIPNIWLDFSLLPRTEMTCLILALRFCSWAVNQLWHHNFICQIKIILSFEQYFIYIYWITPTLWFPSPLNLHSIFALLHNLSLFLPLLIILDHQSTFCSLPFPGHLWIH